MGSEMCIRDRGLLTPKLSTNTELALKPGSYALEAIATHPQVVDNRRLGPEHPVTTQALSPAARFQITPTKNTTITKSDQLGGNLHLHQRGQGLMLRRGSEGVSARGSASCRLMPRPRLSSPNIQLGFWSQRHAHQTALATLRASQRKIFSERC